MINKSMKKNNDISETTAGAVAGIASALGAGDPNASIYGSQKKKKRKSMSKMVRRPKMQKENSSVKEAVEVRHNRYMRSHGKPPRGQGQWYFTSREYGEPDMNDESEVLYVTQNVPYTKAKAMAKKWGRKHGHGQVFVMENKRMKKVREGMADMELRHRGVSMDDIENFYSKWKGKKVQKIRGGEPVGPVHTVVHAQNVMGDELKLDNDEWVKPHQVQVVAEAKYNRDKEDLSNQAFQRDIKKVKAGKADPEEMADKWGKERGAYFLSFIANREGKKMNEAKYKGGDDENTYTIVNTEINKRVGHGMVWKNRKLAQNYLDRKKEDGKGNWDNPAIKVMSIADAKKLGVSGASRTTGKEWNFPIDESSASSAMKKDQAAKQRNIKKAKAYMKRMKKGVADAKREFDLVGLTKDERQDLEDYAKSLNESNISEGYKIGDKVNVTNPNASPRYKIVNKNKTHYTLERPDGSTFELPKKRIEKVNRKAWDKAKTDPETMGKRMSAVNESVLDSMDDDGFMAKRQLYDLAKYAAELHQLIQDTDELEPWVQGKITRASDYISTVKHYLEYTDYRTGETDFSELEAPGSDESDYEGDISDIPAGIDAMYQEPVEEIEEDAYDDEQLIGQDVLRMAWSRRIISDDQFYTPSPELYDIAEYTAETLRDFEELGSSDISIALRGFADMARNAGVPLEGERAGVYISESEAKSRFKNITKKLRGRNG